MIRYESFDVHSVLLEQLAKFRRVSIVTDHSDRKHFAPERRRIRHDIRRAARHELFADLLQDQHRSLARYPTDLPLKIHVRDHVADHQNFFPQHVFDRCRQFLQYFTFFKIHHGVNCQCASNLSRRSLQRMINCEQCKS